MFLVRPSWCLLNKLVARDEPDRSQFQRGGVSHNEQHVEVVPWPKGCGADLLFESAPFSYAFRRSQATFDLQRERLRLIAPLEHKVHALVVNKTRPCIELAFASQDAECSDQMLH